MELHFRFRLNALIDLFVCEDNLNSTDFFFRLEEKEVREMWNMEEWTCRMNRCKETETKRRIKVKEINKK